MKFIFVCSQNQASLDAVPDILLDYRRIETGHRDSVLLVSESDSHHFLNDLDLTGIIQGYVRYPGSGINNIESHNRQLCHDILADRFPLNESVASSFTAFAIDHIDRRIALANDVLGFYPIYFYVSEHELIVASHLLLFSKVRNIEIDFTGVAQRLTGPDYCNFGRRTILKNVFRLLPGECRRIELGPGFSSVCKYDNSLYQGAFTTNLQDSARNVWNTVKQESELCFEYDENISIALSGGMDSRILLGSLPKSKSIASYTYGKDSYYETKIAKQCAEAVGTSFRSFDEEPTLFPDREKLRRYVLETEAVGINQWLSILENTEDSSSNTRKTPIALGESTEAIVARNIKTYSSRRSRIRTFLRLEKIRFEKITCAGFERWKRKNTARILERIPYDELLDHFDINKIRRETASDLDDLYMRLANHDLKFVELLDEIFSWYTHARITTSNQLLLLRSKFYPYCPTMATRCLRAISKVHPSLRLNSKLMDAIFRLPELGNLSNIPSAQIPYISYRRNNTLKQLLWGMRSKTDQMMIRLAALRKKPGSRNRLLKSTNWALAYRQADPKTVESWFSPDYIGKRRFIQIFSKRSVQTAHPLIPMDIVCAAGVNIELEFIESLRSQDRSHTHKSFHSGQKMPKDAMPK